MYHADLEVKSINLRISPTEYYILNFLLGYNSNQVPQIVFKNEKNSTVKKAIRTLNKKKLISKSANLMDMRQTFITVTETGREALNIYENSKPKEFNSTS